MPTVARIGPYRFYFYSSNGIEPKHIHVEREEKTAKYWLKPVHLHYSRAFSGSELIKIQKIIEENRDDIERNWDEFFAS